MKREKQCTFGGIFQCSYVFFTALKVHGKLASFFEHHFISGVGGYLEVTVTEFPFLTSLKYVYIEYFRIICAHYVCKE